MSDITDNPKTYFRQFIPDRDPLLISLEAEAQKEEIPIVGPVVGELLYVLAAAVRGERILELGTATGYSTIFLARAQAGTQGRVITVEADPKLAGQAEANFRKAGLERRIQVVVGDARRVLTGMDAYFDLIFLDIEKADYEPVLPDCTRLIKPGGLLIADNVGFTDADPFNQAIFRSPAWRPVHLFALLPFHSPENDGLCFALRC
jgi:caffeoyl-CoA O-methyltransferase